MIRRRLAPLLHGAVRTRHHLSLKNWRHHMQGCLCQAPLGDDMARNSSPAPGAAEAMCTPPILLPGPGSAPAPAPAPTQDQDSPLFLEREQRPGQGAQTIPCTFEGRWQHWYVHGAWRSMSFLPGLLLGGGSFGSEAPAGEASPCPLEAGEAPALRTLRSLGPVWLNSSGRPPPPSQPFPPF